MMLAAAWQGHLDRHRFYQRMVLRRRAASVLEVACRTGAGDKERAESITRGWRGRGRDPVLIEERVADEELRALRAGQVGRGETERVARGIKHGGLAAGKFLAHDLNRAATRRVAARQPCQRQR